jgi:hypothetical protein
MPKKKTPPAPLITTREFVCNYCKTGFSREKTLLNHLCEKKRRWMDREEKYVQIGFMAYKTFYEKFQGKKNVDFSHFVESQYYTGFTKFGKHVLNINAIEIEEFIRFLITSSVRLDDYTKDETYEMFVRFLTSREPASKALERNVLLMQSWANETKKPWTDFFKEISPSRAVDYIRAGRLSPWVLYNSKSGKELLERLSSEQLVIVWKYIDIRFWEAVFKKHPDDISFIQNIMKQMGL